MKRILVIALIAAAACAAGCRTVRNASSAAVKRSSSQNSALEERYWKLLSIREEPVTGNAREAHIIFHSADGRFSGNAGCNGFSGSFERDGSALKLSRAVSTRMMCPDITAETKFLKALESVGAYSVGGDTLRLFPAGAPAGEIPSATFVAVLLR